MDPEPVSAGSSVNANLLRTGQFSDLTIKCGNYNFRVHKNILCTQSPYFMSACTGGFKVRGFLRLLQASKRSSLDINGTVMLTMAQESFDNTLNFDEEDPSTVWRMLSYLYTETYNSSDPATPEYEPLSKPSELSTTYSTAPATIQCAPIVKEPRKSILNDAAVMSMAYKYRVQKVLRRLPNFELKTA